MDNKQTDNRPTGGSQSSDWTRKPQNQTEDQTEGETKDTQAGGQKTPAGGGMNRNRNQPGRNQPGMDNNQTDPQEENDEENPTAI